MELKNLLSVVIAALTALGAMLFAMGSQNPWMAVALWMAAVVSLVVTDFLGAVRVPRKTASLLMWGVLAIFSPHILLQTNLLQPDWDSLLQSVAGILICLQMVLLFQEKDSRIYGWLAIMSLLQAVVAARYSQGVAFGGLLIAYTIVGVFALSLLALYSQWERHRGQSAVGFSPPSGKLVGCVQRTAREMVGYARKQDLENASHDSETVRVTHHAAQGPVLHPPYGEKGGLKSTLLPSARWPLAAMKSKFTSAPAGTGRSGVVAELFARLTLIAVGALFLATIIFSTVPRHRLTAWRGEARKTVATVGFDDQIALGGLGETIENRQEVMQLKLVDPATGHIYPMRDDVYLRGSVVTCYSQNQWRRDPLSSPSMGAINARNSVAFRVGPPVMQKITMEPYLDRNDLFYIWPLVEPVGDLSSPPLELVGDDVLYDPSGGRLMRRPSFSGEPRGGNCKCEVRTSGLVDGHQAPLIPASREVRVSPYLQMPSDRRPLPRLTALAARWLKESGLPLRKHYEVARWFEQQLSSSGQFQYTLQGQERDTSIDAIEDFVSNNPRGHCEYFATALALMLRSHGIPSRVVLGYHCDEWHEDQQCYQVRQLHAHAWVEAYLDRDQIPAELRGSERIDWTHGGWLRLDPTPAGEAGTQAANRTTWGACQDRWHGLQRAWEKYVVDMNSIKQRESVYGPISRATRNLTSKLLNPRWWWEVAAGLWASLAATLRSGIMGWLFGVVVLLAMAIVPLALGWWLARRLRRLWRRFSGDGGRRQNDTRSAVEFYHRFEQIGVRLGLQRRVGQTPREFASVAGARLAAVSGRREFYAWAVQMAEVFYRVRFGRQELDAPAAQAVEQALKEFEK